MGGRRCEGGLWLVEVGTSDIVRISDETVSAEGVNRLGLGGGFDFTKR